MYLGLSSFMDTFSEASFIYAYLDSYKKRCPVSRFLIVFTKLAQKKVQSAFAQSEFAPT